MTTVNSSHGVACAWHADEDPRVVAGGLTDPTARLCAEVAAHLDDDAAAARLARRASLDLAARAAAAEVAQLHQAADLTMASKIVGGITTAASAIVGAGGSDAGATHGDAVVARLIEATGTSASGILDASARHAQADGQGAKTTGERRAARATEFQEDAQRAERLADKARDHAEQLLSARDQARRGVLRG